MLGRSHCRHPVCTLCAGARAAVYLYTHMRAFGSHCVQLDAEVFRHTIEGINYHFEAAEQHTSALYWRNFANCLTGYVGDFCLANPYDKHLNAMSAYVEEQNSSVYNPRGLALINPLDRGLRVIEITNLPGKAVVLEKSSV